MYLDSVGDVLNNVGVALRELPSSEAAIVRQSMTSTSRHYSDVKKPKLARTRSKNLALVTGEDGHLQPGELLYIYI